MGFEVLPLTLHDIEAIDPIDPHIDVFEMTSPSKWDPEKFRVQALEAIQMSDAKVTEITDVVEDEVGAPNKSTLHSYFTEATFTPFEPEKHPFDVEQLETAFSTHAFDDVDAILDQMTFEQITSKESFHPDSFGYPILETEDHEKEIMFDPTNATRHVYLTLKPWQRVLYPPANPGALRKFFGYRPKEIVQKTLECTLQTAKHIFRHPQRKHLRPRNFGMNIPRLPEMVSTDPIFANCKSIHDGFWGTQIYLGKKSKYLNGYGFKSKAEMPNNYEDFIRNEGAPSALRRDNAKRNKVKQ